MAVIGYLYLAGTPHTLKDSFPRALCQWDCDWYLALAQHGYNVLPPHSPNFSGVANWAFFPLFPLLIRFAHYILHVDYLYAALIVANLSFLAGAFALYRYVEQTEGHAPAMFATALACFSPYAIYFAIPYTESTFFALSVLTFLFARNAKWVSAGVCAALLTATRCTSVLVVFPLFLIALKQYGIKDLIAFRAKGGTPAFALLLAPLGLFAFMLFLHLHVGDALAFKSVQYGFSRNISNPLGMLEYGLRRFPHADFYFAVVSLFGFGMTLFLACKKRYAEALFMLTVMLPSLTTGLSGMPRFTFALFPIYVGMTLLLSGHRLAQAVILVAAIGADLYLITAWVHGPLFMI